MRAQNRAAGGTSSERREDQGKLPQDSDAQSVTDSRIYFHELTRDEQARAICKLADDGMSEYTAAAATGLSVEQIRAVLAERAER